MAGLSHSPGKVDVVDDDQRIEGRDEAVKGDVEVVQWIGEQSRLHVTVYPSSVATAAARPSITWGLASFNHPLNRARHRDLL